MTIEAATESLAELGRQYVDGGLSIIVVGPDKRPLGKWKHRQTKAATVAEIQRELQHPDAAGLAVVCGKVSGGLLIIDFDEPGIYREWLQLVGDEADGLSVQRTGHQSRGRYQVALRCENPGPNTELAYVPDENEDAGRRVAIETRGEGGYAVLPGSLHPSGNRYEAIGDYPWTEIPTRAQTAVDFMLECARKLCRAPLSKQQQMAAAQQAKPLNRASRNGQVSVIEAFNAAHDIREVLRDAGYLPFGDRFTRPGADASPGGVVILDGRSFHHSSNDALHDGHVHDAFDVWTHYRHGGDCSEAVKTAAAKLGIHRTAHESPDDSASVPMPLSFALLCSQYPSLNPPVIDGILRNGETCNIIAPSKVGKSWLTYDLALSIIAGRRWLDSFQCTAGDVLLIDNELHPPTIAHRIPKVAEARGIPSHDYADRLDVLSLRGLSVSIHSLRPIIDRIEAGRYRAIIADAWYRFIPSGMNENSNADIMALYNTLDSYAGRTEAAWLVVHHSSKGNQADKSVTDVGSGAGAQSRAADAHLVLRQHEDDGYVVLDAAVRSFPPVAPVGLSWEFPVWNRTLSLDVTALKGRKSKAEERQSERDAEGMDAIRKALASGAMTERQIRMNTGYGQSRAQRLIGKLSAAGEVKAQPIRIGGLNSEEYHLAK